MLALPPPGALSAGGLFGALISAKKERISLEPLEAIDFLLELDLLLLLLLLDEAGLVFAAAGVADAAGRGVAFSLAAEDAGAAGFVLLGVCGATALAMEGSFVGGGGGEGLRLNESSDSRLGGEADVVINGRMGAGGKGAGEALLLLRPLGVRVSDGARMGERTRCFFGWGELRGRLAVEEVEDAAGLGAGGVAMNESGLESMSSMSEAMREVSCAGADCLLGALAGEGLGRTGEGAGSFLGVASFCAATTLRAASASFLALAGDR